MILVKLSSMVGLIKSVFDRKHALCERDIIEIINGSEK